MTSELLIDNDQSHVINDIVDDQFVLDPVILENAKTKHEKSDSTEEFKLGIALYTDGGGLIGNRFLGSPNLASYGVHGFVYSNTPTKTGAGVKGYTPSDLGYTLNGMVGRNAFDVRNMFDTDMGVIRVTPNTEVTILAYIDISGNLIDATNNVGEATAFNKGLEIAARLHQQHPITRVHVRSDSQYVLGTISNRDTLRRNEYRKASDGQLIANLELWKDIFAHIETLPTNGVEWTYEWVKGHQDSFGNIQADKLATMGLTAARNGHMYENLSVNPAQGHWTKSNSADLHYFLTDTKWYVNTSVPMLRTDDGKHVLFTGTHEDDERVGQLTSDGCQSVVILNDVPEVLEDVKKMTLALDSIDSGMEVGGVYYGNLPNILNPAVGGTIGMANGKFVKVNRNKKQLFCFDGKEFMTKLEPPRLVYEGMTAREDLYELLDRFRLGKLNPWEKATDVTSTFYSTVAGKKKDTVKLNIGNEASLKVYVDVNVKNKDNVYSEVRSDVTLTYGITAPRRRVFSGVKDDNPKVFVITVFEPYVIFRYFTVIQLENGECAIWTNVAANTRVFG